MARNFATNLSAILTFGAVTGAPLTNAQTAEPAPEAETVTISCPADTIEAQTLCGDPDIGQAYAKTFFALKAWEDTGTKNASVEARRAAIAVRFANNFAVFDRDGQSTAEKKDDILGYLQYMTEDAQSSADFAALVPRVALYPALLDQCAVEAPSCSLISSGKLYGNSDFRDGELIEIAWQRVSLIDDLQGRSEAVMAWEIVGPRANLIGFVKTDGSTQAPQLTEDDVGYALAFPAVGAGTGRANADVLYRRDNSGWRNIDVESWKEQRDARLPDDVEVWKGVTYSDDMGIADFSLWRETDANCCPSGGEGTAYLQIRGNKLVLGDIDIRRKGRAGLTCPVEQVEYTLMGNTADTARFVKPEIKPNAATDYILEIAHQGTTQRHYGFVAAQGWGGASLVPLDGVGDATAPAVELADNPDEDAHIFGFNELNDNVVAADVPPTEGQAPPTFLFMPSVSRSLWYDGGVNSRGTSVARIDSPLNLWVGNCPQAPVFETSASPEPAAAATTGEDTAAPDLGYDFPDSATEGTADTVGE